MSSSRQVSTQVSQLKTVFEACDRTGKGYITSDDVLAATQDLPEDERTRLIELLGAVDGKVDYQTFGNRVTHILELADKTPPSPLPPQKPQRSSRTFLKQSAVFALSSPFRPRHNSTDTDDLTVGNYDHWEADADEEGDKDIFEARGGRSTRKKLREKRRSKFISAESDTSEPSLRPSDHPRDVISRDLSASRDFGTSRDPRVFRESRESGFSSPGSPTDTARLVEDTVSAQLTSKMTAVEARLDQLNDTARQSRNEISNLVDLVINRSFDRGDSVERVVQNAKEVWQMEKELIENFHIKEVEQLRHINELQTKKLEEEAMFAKDGCARKNKQIDSHMEDKIKNMKNHCLLLEKRKKSEQEELADALIKITQQREELKEEKSKVSLEKRKLKSKNEELSIEREELMAEKKIIQLEIDFLKQEKERFYCEKACPVNNKNDHSFVMIETTGHYENALKENQELKSSLKSLADERSTISEALKEAFKDKVKIENDYIRMKESKFQLENKFEEYLNNNGEVWGSKIKTLTTEIDDQKKIIIELSKEKESLKKSVKESEDVVKNLMDIIDGHKRTVTKKQCLEEWNKDLKEQNKIMIENLRQLDHCMIEAQDSVDSLKDKNNYLQKVEKEHDNQIVAQTKVIKELRDEVSNLVEDKLALAEDHDNLKQYVKSVVKKFTRTKSGAKIEGDNGDSLKRRTSSTSKLFSRSASSASIME